MTIGPAIGGKGLMDGLDGNTCYDRHLLHCTEDIGRPMLGPTRPGPEGEAFLRNAYHDIPLVVPAIREYWMPQRVKECSN